MDTELARTFLTVVAAGSFVRAAERLHVTQSTVSARIQALEQYLGAELFVRNKAGTTLTASGRQFQKHAATLMRTVEKARQDVGVPAGFEASLAVGARIGIWEGFLSRWLPEMRADSPTVAVRAEIGFDDELMQGLVEGRLDIGAMYTPQSRPGLIVELLFEEELILVSTGAKSGDQPDPDYVHVDWGPEFSAKHGASFPDFAGAWLTANIGWLGLHHILDFGGSGYFPRRLVSAAVADDRLRPVERAPTFNMPVYVVYPRVRDQRVFDPALDGMRKVAAALSGQ